MENRISFSGTPLLNLKLTISNPHLEDLVAQVQLIGFIDPLRLFRAKKGYDTQGARTHTRPGVTFHRGRQQTPSPFT